MPCRSILTLAVAILLTAVSSVNAQKAKPAGGNTLYPTVLHPGTSLLTVTRTSATSWTIEASADDAGGLTSATTSGKAVKVNEGYYRLPYRIVVTQ